MESARKRSVSDAGLASFLALGLGRSSLLVQIDLSHEAIKRLGAWVRLKLFCRFHEALALLGLGFSGFVLGHGAQSRLICGRCGRPTLLPR